jgi:hypothetical protein
VEAILAHYCSSIISASYRQPDKRREAGVRFASDSCPGAAGVTDIAAALAMARVSPRQRRTRRAVTNHFEPPRSLSRVTPPDRLAAMVKHRHMDGSRERGDGNIRNKRARLHRALVALGVCLALLSWAGPTPALPEVPAGSAPVVSRPLQATAALPSSAAPAPRISVLTFGPGSETFSKFGHDAVWVHDASQPPSRRDLVFNYGTFRFDSPWLIIDFLKGNLRYWLSASTLERTLGTYRAANRSVNAQELELTPETARAINAFLHENVKPENAYYRYDYYRDN